MAMSRLSCGLLYIPFYTGLAMEVTTAMFNRSPIGNRSCDQDPPGDHGRYRLLHGTDSGCKREKAISFATCMLTDAWPPASVAPLGW